MKYLSLTEIYWVRYLSIPIIVSMIIPLIMLDIFLEVYHNICFRLYKIPLVKRASYISIDRHKLEYLSFWQKTFCVYCGYANGLVHYAFAIAGLTEEYWCGIKHDKKEGFVNPPHHKNFLKYNDKQSFNKYLTKLSK